MKPNLTLNTGAESTDVEINEILSVFSPYYEVTVKKSIARFSADLLPFIINFSIAAVVGGVVYDGLKLSLIALQEKFRQKKIERSPAASIRYKDSTYILTESEIKLRSIDVEISFKTVDEFIDFIEKSNDSTIK